LINPADRRPAPSWYAAGIGQLPASDAWVDDVEAARFAAMRFAKRRSESKLARFTAKQTVARFLEQPLSPGDLRRVTVRNASDGAPYVSVDGHEGELEIAMTDRADWAVCAVATEAGRIGCDLELVEPRSAAFVRDYFTAAEQELAAGIGDRSLAANLIWSAKESALKVLRTGLRRDTRTVEVALSERTEAGWSELRVGVDQERSLPGWWIRYGEFLLTIVSEHPTGPPTSLATPPPLAAAEPGHAWMTAPVDG
jgi:4'-phosphopantetheinyl transferase